MNDGDQTSPPTADMLAAELSARERGALVAALTAVPGFAGLDPGDLEPTGAFGLSHDHVRVARVTPEGMPVLLRIPRLSQLGLDPQAALVYQAESFRRLAPAGHTPILVAALPVCKELPQGAFLVEDVGRTAGPATTGRPPLQPDDLPAMARCLAAIHALPVPSPSARSPLPDNSDLLAGPVAAIGRQMAFVEAGRAELDAAAIAAIHEEWQWVQTYFDEHRSVDVLCPVLTDTHAGNFVMRDDGEGTVALFVDLEKVAYGCAAADLAHATLYPSAAWDPRCGRPLEPDDVRGFYASYLACLTRSEADRLRPWLQPMRRLIWLRTTTFFAKWRSVRADAGGWSARALPPSVEAHIDRHTADCLSPERIAEIREEWTGPARRSDLFA